MLRDRSCSPLHFIQDSPFSKLHALPKDAKPVRMILHCHVHEDRADVVSYTDPRKIYVAGAGSFGAGKVERSESKPTLYNLIQVARNHRWAKVHTRCLRKEGGAWEGWAVWPGEKADERKTYYEIRFD